MDEQIEPLSHGFPWELPYDERFLPHPLKPQHFFNDDTVSVWAPLEDAPGWRVSMVFALRSGTVELVDVRVHPSSASSLDEVPNGGIGRRMLAGIPLGQITAAARREFSSEVVTVDGQRKVRKEAVLFGRRWADAPAATEPRAAARRGRPGRPDRFYAEAARAFVRHRDGGSRAPRKDAGAELGIPARKMPDILRTARQRGLLLGGARGRSEGQLTEKAKSILTGEAD
jgi:hypothetical protein